MKRILKFDRNGYKQHYHMFRMSFADVCGDDAFFAIVQRSNYGIYTVSNVIAHEMQFRQSEV